MIVCRAKKLKPKHVFFIQLLRYGELGVKEVHHTLHIFDVENLLITVESYANYFIVKI